MSNYPFANGMVLAAKDGTGWKTRILTGSAYYAEGGLLNSFYKILDDGTIAYYLLEDAGWTVELIDPNTLETLLTMDFGGYSPEYLSLEGEAPLSISGDISIRPGSSSSSSTAALPLSLTATISWRASGSICWIWNRSC